MPPFSAGARQGSQSLLHAFNGRDGASPEAGVLVTGSTIFGTTDLGGNRTCLCGTVFELTQQGSHWSETVLHRFRGAPDGANPLAGVIIDTNGSLFGTTQLGGSVTFNNGTVYELKHTTSGYRERVVVQFLGGVDGGDPAAELTAGTNGEFYGTTLLGGNNPSCSSCGTVFKLTKAGEKYHESVIYAFKGFTANDGQFPAAAVLLKKDGTLFGTTSAGGQVSSQCPAGCGTVFELTPTSSGKYIESVLHSFAGGNDGITPLAALTADNAGNLFGTTVNGGGSVCPSGCGTVFKLVQNGSAWQETIAYHFQGGGVNDLFGDGANPKAALIVGRKHELLGTTAAGGMGCPSTGGCGTVFRLTPNGSTYLETVLYRFPGGKGYASPVAPLTPNAAGSFLSTAEGSKGKACRKDCGVVFELTP